MSYRGIESKQKRELIITPGDNPYLLIVGCVLDSRIATAFEPGPRLSNVCFAGAPRSATETQYSAGITRWQLPDQGLARMHSLAVSVRADGALTGAFPCGYLRSAVLPDFLTGKTPSNDAMWETIMSQSIHKKTLEAMRLVKGPVGWHVPVQDRAAWSRLHQTAASQGSFELSPWPTSTSPGGDFLSFSPSFGVVALLFPARSETNLSSFLVTLKANIHVIPDPAAGANDALLHSASSQFSPATEASVLANIGMAVRTFGSEAAGVAVEAAEVGAAATL